MTYNTKKNTFANNSKIFFNSVLYPSRSLSNLGFFFLMLTFALILTFISIFFYRLGAWPILFFTVIDLFLIWGAFKINYKNGRTYEIIKLTYFKLEITRVYPNGTKSRVYFEPSWVKIWLDNSPLHNSSIRIRSHGNQIILGSFLPPKEKYEVMESLKNALKNRLDFIKQEKLSSI